MCVHLLDFKVKLAFFLFPPLTAQKGSRTKMECFPYDPTPHGKANATYASPDFLFSFPPPQAMTTYCFPSTAYTEGVANPAAGRSVSRRSWPVRLLKTLNLAS